MSRTTPRIIFVLAFLFILILTIGYARGYRLDFKKKIVTSTGILAVSSSPPAARVYINGELKGVTDINLTLPPGKYDIEIKKDGFIPWSKSYSLKGEWVVSVEALLFPLNPSLSPLTNLGVVKAIPFDQTGRIIIFSQNDDEKKDGIYLFDPGKKTFSLLPPLKLIVLKKDLPLPDTVDFAKCSTSFSPDYKQAIFDWDKIAYLLPIEENGTTPFEVTASKDVVIQAWDEQKAKDTQKIIETFPREIAKIATSSFQIISFSPDETKMLYTTKSNLDLPTVINPPLIAANQAKEERHLQVDGLYVYDKREDKNFSLPQELAKQPTDFFWYFDSKYFLFIENTKKISIVDYSGGNKQTVYSGPLENSFFVPTAEGKIAILANLNPEINKLPDLYLVGIK